MLSKAARFEKMNHTDVPMTSNSLNGTNVTSSVRIKHAPMPIYRPPSLRDGYFASSEKGKLNVHAKEFVMSSGGSRIGNVTKNGFADNEDVRSISSVYKDDNFKADRAFPLKLSKSYNNNVTLSKPDASQSIKTSSYKYIPNLTGSSTNNLNCLQRTKSIGDVLLNNTPSTNSSSKVQFKTSLLDKNNNRSGKNPVKEKKYAIGQPILGGLKRSQSLGAADAQKLMEMEASFPNYSAKFTEYYLFPEKMHDLISKAIQNVNRLTDKDKILLARSVVEHAIKSSKNSLPGVKLCVIVMEKDKSGAFSDSLLNTCQMFYERKETALLLKMSTFISFLTFLTEMFSELKRSKLQIRLLSDSITPPKITLLILISRCCEDILLSKEAHSVSEIECLFLTITAVGRDIEFELPEMFGKLFCIIRFVLLKRANTPQIQKTLLQLIELRAANWQLPISALNYYYPKSSN